MNKLHLFSEIRIPKPIFSGSAMMTVDNRIWRVEESAGIHRVVRPCYLRAHKSSVTQGDIEYALEDDYVRIVFDTARPYRGTPSFSLVPFHHGAGLPLLAGAAEKEIMSRARAWPLRSHFRVKKKKKRRAGRLIKGGREWIYARTRAGPFNVVLTRSCARKPPTRVSTTRDYPRRSVRRPHRGSRGSAGTAGVHAEVKDSLSPYATSSYVRVPPAGIIVPFGTPALKLCSPFVTAVGR